MRVGLTGGIGSGKSEVARILESLGAYIVDTDRLAREAVAPGSDGLRQIAHAWPNVVRDGYLDRAALAQIVFHDPDARERLNQIVHPHVRRLADECDRFAKPGQLIVHVVPLLFETGYAQRTDASILVVAPDEERIRRCVKRDRMTEEQVRARMASQIDPSQARERATYVIDNDGDLAHLRERTREVYEVLTRRPV
jgi:dephospho-CoA kinase